mgnify:CR=1 FL=1
MQYDVLYVGLLDRDRQAKVHEGMGRRMVSDMFAPGMINAGTMIFTDEPAPAAKIEIEVETELADLKRRIEKLEAK